MLKDLDRNFGIEVSQEEEKQKFISRIKIFTFDEIVKFKPDHYRFLFRYVCHELGENPDEYFDFFNGNPNLYLIVEKSPNPFLDTLKIIVVLYSYFKRNYGGTNMVYQIDNKVKDALDKSSNLGISWKDGMFYPTGEKVLDEQLIEGSLECLKNYPDEQRDLKKALQSFWSGEKRDIGHHCHSAVETLAQKILGNDKNLDNNKEELNKALSLSGHWNKILFHFVKYSHELRHNSANKASLIENDNEVESYLYLTCIMIKAIVGQVEKNKTI